MQVRSKLEVVSDELADMSLHIRQMLAGGGIDPFELQELAELARERMPQAINQVESAIVDNALVGQILKLGHEVAPNRHLLDRIKQVDEVVIERQRITAPLLDREAA